MSVVLPNLPTESASAVGGTVLPPLARALGFNCPACGVVLTISNPTSYDGRPAPCPQCAVMVVPPRIFQPGDEESDPIELHPLPGLCARAGERIKMPRAVHRRPQLCAASDEISGVWIGGLPDGVVMSGHP